MRFLHTSDWHLGQKFINQSRDAEHLAALDWLIQTIENERVDALVVAGDIFDVNNPPVSAEEIYYRFLTRLMGTCCRHVVIVGGNHDLPSRLNAPSGLLRALNVHVVGAATDDFSDEIVELREKNGQLAAVIAAVPFLRDRDLKISVAGENTAQRMEAIKLGIAEHFARAGEICLERRGQLPADVPFLVTGHLFATGASSSGEQRNIYIGNLENITAEKFPEVFDYVALGHIHRPQRIAKLDHIRYSGSLIPLNFSEIQDKKIVLILDFLPEKKHPAVREIQVPIFRKLLRLAGNLSEIEKKLAENAVAENDLPGWVEVTVSSPGALPNLSQTLRDTAKKHRLEILSVKLDRPANVLAESFSEEILEQLTPEDIFRKKIEKLPEVEREELVETFRELQDWVAQAK